MHTNTVAIMDDRKRRTRKFPGGAVFALATALLLGSAGIAAAHGAGGGGRGPGYGMGPGMMMGPQGGQGYGMGPGMMGPQGPQGGQGMMAPGAGSGQPAKDLTAEDVRARLETWLTRMGNPRLEVGEVKEVDEDTIIADIVTKEGKVVVDRFRINRHTGAMERVG